MPYAYDKYKTGQIQNQDMNVGQGSLPIAGGIPNSAMRSRLHQTSSAEAEADLLSAGISASGPNAVKREMGARLGADFSSVNMHTDADSVSKANHMGARAMAQGNDIYFGQGGFDPEIAAHELVHTVQQGTVQGTVNQTAPTGSVQLWPFGKKSAKKDSKNKPKKPSKEEKNRINEKIDSVFRMAAAHNVDGMELTAFKEAKLQELKAQFLPKYIKQGLKGKLAEDYAVDEAYAYIREHYKEEIGDKYNRQMTEEEEEEYLKIISEMSRDEIKEVLRRRTFEAKKVSKLHESISKREGNPADKTQRHKIDFLTSQSEDAYNFNILDLILSNLRENNQRRFMIVMDAYMKEQGHKDDEKVQHAMDASTATSGNNFYLNPEDESLQPARDAEKNAALRKEMDYHERIKRGEVTVSSDRYDKDPEEDEEQAHDSGHSIFLDDAEIVKSPVKDRKEPVAPKQARNDSFSDNSEYGIPSRKGSQIGPSIEDNLIIDTHSNKSAYEEDDDNFDKNKNNDPLSRLNEMDPVEEIGDPLLDLPLSAGHKSSGGSKPGSIDEQIDVLKSRAGKDKPMTIDQQMLLQAFEHAKRVDKTNNKVGGVKAGAAGVGLALGFVAASGPVAPVTAAAMGLAGITGGIGALIFDKRKKKQMRNNIVLDYLGMNSWEEIENLARKMTKSPKLSAKAARGVYLKSHGLGRNRDEAFKIIVEKRADFLIKKAESGDKDAELAQNVISKLGIERKKGKYGKSALKKLMSRLS